MSKSPAFLLYASDFYMDTLTWDNEEVGIYLRLLLFEWINGPLKNDQKELAGICGIRGKNWERIWSPISQQVLKKFSLLATNLLTFGSLLAQFKIKNENEYLINLRLEEERQKHNSYIEKQRLKGIASAKIRSTTVIATVQPTPQPEGNPSNPNPNPEYIKEAKAAKPISLTQGIGQEKPGHFSQKMAEDTINRLKELSQFYSQQNGFNFWQFIQKNQNKHPTGIVRTFERVKESIEKGNKVEKIWPFLQTILNGESKHFREADAIQAHNILMEEFKKFGKIPNQEPE